MYWYAANETPLPHIDILLTFILLHTVGRMWTIQVTVYTMKIEPRG